MSRRGTPRSSATLRWAQCRLGLLLTLALGLAACGGGGGSDGSSSGSGTSGGTPVLTASTAAVSATAAPAAAAPSLGVNLSIANPQAGGFYYVSKFLGSAVASASINWSPTPVNGAQSGSIDLMLELPEFMGSGVFHDTVTIMVCTDSQCANQIAGSPLSIAVTYTVTGNAVSDATYSILPDSISLEAPSNGAAPSTSINATAYELPPYGAYVFFTSQVGGAVASMAFQQTSANEEPFAYGTGVLTVNMKTPASLGPGLYSDLISLSICYDSACNKPSVGSPFKIPVTYVVTASEGREYQQQIVNQNLTALAVDPTGSILYGVTAPGDENLPNPVPAQLVEINPTTTVVTALLSLPSAVSQIVVSQDGAYLYLLTEPWGIEQLSPAIEVLRVPTANISIDQTVDLTNVTVNPAQIAVSPLNSNAWSAAFESTPNVFTAEIFDGSTPRPDAWTVTSDVVYGNQALWSANGSTMYVLDANLNAVAVSASGMENGTQLQPGGASQGGFDFGGNLQLAAGLLYSGGGQVLNPVTNAILGQYPLPSGVPYAAFTADPVNNRTFAAYIQPMNDSAEGTIQSFNLSAFTSISIARLPVGTQPLRWGSNGLAWIGPGAVMGTQALYLINGAFVAP